MVDTNYRVIRRDNESFAVEVTTIGALPKMVASFATEADAEAWIAQDERFRDAADPFKAPTGHRRRKF